MGRAPTVQPRTICGRYPQRRFCHSAPSCRRPFCESGPFQTRPSAREAPADGFSCFAGKPARIIADITASSDPYRRRSGRLALPAGVPSNFEIRIDIQSSFSRSSPGLAGIQYHAGSALARVRKFVSRELRFCADPLAVTGTTSRRRTSGSTLELLDRFPVMDP